MIEYYNILVINVAMSLIRNHVLKLVIFNTDHQKVSGLIIAQSLSMVIGN